jgi:hypothetical protein
MILLAILILQAWLAQTPAPAVEAAKPLPEMGSFLEGIRGKLHADRTLLGEYTYTERTVIQTLDGNGRPKKAPETRVYEVYPAADSREPYRKLIFKNGKPVEKKQEEAQRNPKPLSADEIRRREAKGAEARRKEREAIDEAFRLYKITMTGREQFDGHPAIVLEFEPRPEYKPKTSEGKTLAKVRGKALFCESDYELMGIDAVLTDNFTIGYGLLAKVSRGTRIVFQRRRINDEIWLPSMVHASAKIRALLLVGLNLDIETSYSDYKKFSVETKVQYSR